MSLYDICCFVPAWFGAIDTVTTGLMTYEACLGSVSDAVSSSSSAGGGDVIPQRFGSLLSHVPFVNTLYQRVIVPVIGLLMRLMDAVFGKGNLGIDTGAAYSFGARPSSLSSPALESALCAMAIMSVVPAHLMRSVGGGYDNESVAMTAMTLTFWLWMRSLRGDGSSTGSALRWGVAAGIAYFYMAAVWGGYVFVINLIGVHASLLVALGRHSPKLHRAYTSFYLVGTFLATRVPVVDMAPLKSMEQLGPLVAFVAIQLVEFCESRRRKGTMELRKLWILRIKVFGAAAIVAVLIGMALWPTGYFGPISARVRGLFVEHTKTGNPLVDSVAEHQPASSQAYVQYLSDAVYIAPVGFALVALFYFHDSSSFLLVYGMAAYFFSHKMVRLILLTSPIASSMCGVAMGRVVGWALTAVSDYRPGLGDFAKGLFNEADKAVESMDKKGKADDNDGDGKGKEQNQKNQSKSKSGDSALSILRTFLVRLARIAAFYYLLTVHALPRSVAFRSLSHQLARQMSHPTILQKAKTRSGAEVIIDDYRDAYLWLKTNTPEDARIMAWWDYGYQITGIGDRTTIADGNTWNHEHIALLGRTLTSPEKDGHRIARHLADYVLVWAGGGGDDLAKSPHLARIANSIYRTMCPGDPTCRTFGFTGQGVPSSMMEASLLYKLHSHRLRPDVEVDKNRFKHVYDSKNGKVRIFKILSVSQDSKKWVENNKVCDVPGGWYCPGQYPPALRKVLKEGRNFAQLEDFNRKENDEEYQKSYFENLKKSGAAPATKGIGPKKETEELSEEKIIQFLNQKDNWKDTDITSQLWDIIANNRLDEMKALIQEMTPKVLHFRSSDGRGPMFWAHENGRVEMLRLLKKYGVSETVRDAEGKTPLDFSRKR